MLSDEEKLKIIHLSEEGWSISRISKEVGRDPKTVRKSLGQVGKKARDPVRDTEKDGPSNKEDEGKLSARVFRRLNSGEPLEVIVEKEEITPGEAIELYEKWREIKDLQRAGDILEQAKSMLDSIQGSIKMIYSTTNRVRALEQGADATPLWNLRGRHACPRCGRRGSVVVTVMCSNCGHMDNLGCPSNR